MAEEGESLYCPQCQKECDQPLVCGDCQAVICNKCGTVLEKVADTQVNGTREHRLPNTTSIAFDGIESEGVLMLLDKAGICCSAGSACTTGSLHPSHVLKAMGFSNERARASLRFSFSRFNTKAEVEKALEVLPRLIAKLRQMTLAA